MGDFGSIIGGAGAAAGGAASIAQFFQGKDASDQAKDLLGQQSEAAQRLFNMQMANAMKLQRQTGPLRTGVAGILRGVLAGGRGGPFQIFAPEREMVEQQFGRARENIVAGGQRGGMLQRSLTDLDIGRAQTLGGMESDIRRRGFEDALRVGFGVAPSVQFPSFGGEALANLGASQQASAGAGLGSIAGIGALLALKQGRGGGGGGSFFGGSRPPDAPGFGR